MKARMKPILLVAGGVNVLFLLFHLAFYSLFNWKETLVCLSQSNWAIFLTFYFGSILIVGMMAYTSLRFPDQLYTTLFGKAVSIVYSLFYIIRIAAQFLLFGFVGTMSFVIVMLCALPAAAYLLAAVSPAAETNVAESAAK